MKYIILIVFFIAGASEAGTYLDVGIGIHNGEFDSFSQYRKDTRTVHKISPIIGTIEWGYEFDNISVFFRHDSSLKQTDTGLNMIGVKIRL